jgi:hypothetical protein
MNDQPQSIAKTPVLKPAEDFYRLRQDGISFIEEMGSQLWTDYNAHDPGVTILEAFCYAITELGYRTGWDIKDMLTPDPAEKKAALPSQKQTSADQESPYPGQAFFPARKILTVNPVTTDDFRRLLISLEGVRNAWVTKAKCDHFKEYLLKIKENCNEDPSEEGQIAEEDDISYGLYDVLLELENEEQKDEVIESAKKELHAHRNLCEDFCCIRTVGIEYIAVCANIEVRPDTDIELIQAHVVHEIENYFSPPIPFYTLQELLDAGEKIEDIFNGPVPDNGFIKPADLQRADLRGELYTSDLINILMDIDGIIAIRDLHLFKRDEVGKVKGNDTRWVLFLKEQHKAKLWKNKEETDETAGSESKLESNGKTKPNTQLTFYRNGIPSLVDLHQCDDTMNQLCGETERSKDAATTENIPIPVGTFRGLNGYFPVQYSLPTTYGIGPEGLPAHASETRRAKAKQLQGYLMAFEQILANSFSQLEHVRDLFSLDQEMKESYFIKDIDETILQGVDELFKSSSELPEDDSLMCLAADDDKKVEQDCSRCAYGGQKAMPLKSNAGLYAQRAMDDILPKVAQTERRNRFLDHLMARFGEQFDEQALLFKEQQKQQTATQDLVNDKISFIKQYKETGPERRKAFDYTATYSSKNVSGLQKRISSLLDLGYPNLKLFFPPDSVQRNPWVCNGYTVKFSLKNTTTDESWLTGCITVSSPTKDQAQAVAETRLKQEIIRTKSYKICCVGKKFILKLSLKCKGTCAWQNSKYPGEFEHRAEAENLRDRLIGWGTKKRAVIVEHILLRPKFPGDFCYPDKKKSDPYSYQLTVIMPGCGAPYNTDVAMRNYAERVIREETPAHLLVNILWVRNDCFNSFEKTWQRWLEANAQVDWTERLEKKIQKIIMEKLPEDQLPDLIAKCSTKIADIFFEQMKKRRDCTEYDFDYGEINTLFENEFGENVCAKKCILNYLNKYKEASHYLCNLLKQLIILRNTYPPARLHDWDNSKSGGYDPVRLGETLLGGCTEEDN